MSATDSKPTDTSQRLRRTWRGLVRQAVRGTGWMVSHGVPARVAVSIVWIVALVVLAVLLYVAVWIAVVVVMVLIAAASVQHADEDEQPKWLQKDPNDHREDLFYHPLSYNDDPDPRFYDPRHNGK